MSVVCVLMNFLFYIIVDSHAVVGKNRGLMHPLP